ncbi:MAG: DUF2270 domain-containing protein [Thermoanaerobaculia bacterium]
MAIPEPQAQTSFEDYPLTRPEYISALVHLYRGELARANVWRSRLDTTTNWAVLTTMGLLSYGFNAPSNSHASLIVGMIMVTNFLLLEARRYRVCDVWNSRLRMIEENFYGPILRRDLTSPRVQWGQLVAGDLLHPRYKVSYWQAIRARLVRNYIALYALLLIAWVDKVSIHPVAIFHGGSLAANVGLGPIPWWVVGGVVLTLYGFLVGLLVLVSSVAQPESEWEADHRMGVGEHL